MSGIARTLLLVGAAGCLVARPARGEDWPTWRFGPGRRGASPEALSERLHLQWTRQLRTPLLAWPNEPRLHFDAAYEPVAAGGSLFLGSPNDGSVRAFDAATGRERWRVHTEGPVRFAPVAWRGRVYAGSDDGWLYCLDAAKGTLLWKVRGAPEDRPDRRHLGNARLVSFWPVRGGPVLVDGAVYFAAGIWPSLGVFVTALDAETGGLLWRNGRAGFIEKVRLDHNTLHEAGLSPQGYLVVEDNRLLVPNGRSMPAVLDRGTGRLLRYVQGYRNGDCRVAAVGDLAFVGTTGVVDIPTGREVGSRWAQAGKDAPDTFISHKVHLFEGPFFPYKMFPGCSAWSVLAPGVAYGAHRGTFYAYDLRSARVSEYDKEQGGHTLKPWRWDAPALWTLRTEHAKAGPASTALIQAGSRLYGHAGKTLLAVDLPEPGGKPKLAWSHDLDDTPSSLLAADGRLFVVTREGRIHCFGAPRAAAPRSHPLKTVAAPTGPDKGAAAARTVLGLTKATEGYCLVLGVGADGLVEGLLAHSKLKVIAVDRDRAAVHALRERLAALGVYGTRAEAFVGEPFDFPFPPYLASLVVASDLETAGFSAQRPARTLFEVLRPYGGVACLAVPQEQRAAVEQWVAAGRLERAELERAGGFVLLRRVGALPGSASWTHETADAARTFFSTDQRVRAPLGVLWYGDGPGHGFWKRKDYGIGVKPQVVDGRLFAFQIGRRTLHAYDVFTGRSLWQRQVDPFTRYASMHDGIYVAGGDGCQVLDPATGAPLKSFTLHTRDPQGRAAVVADLRVADDLILVALAPEKVRVIEKGLWDSSLLVALDRTTGRQLWRRQATRRFNNNAIAVGRDAVFCIDSVSAIQTGAAERRGQAPDSLPSTILALDARTGRTRWSEVTTNPHRTYGMGGWLGIRGNDDWLAYCADLRILLAGKHGLAHAFDASAGRELWQQRVGPQPLILRGETFIPQNGVVFDTRTGKPISSRSLFQRGGCNYAVANPHLAFVRDRSVCYVDLASETRHYLRNVRSGCSNSLVAADGLLNVPNFAVGCVCNYPIQTAFALVHMPEVAAWAGDAPLTLPETRP